ncbi:down syndrome cell adhesion molecule-like protein Dscam2 [Caerostris extrusa]|uniref:Down syndrome cell adhesion molecule-like protein Dscam2 n=1 Tax=Caerostris extrusa TaxID=172846 RepID=A0AAV4PF13_CAEEX|nr:down syndrome cell adhesion molecule-like protein Dscam2 [Caerostris extrusa]
MTGGLGTKEALCSWKLKREWIARTQILPPRSSIRMDRQIHVCLIRNVLMFVAPSGSPRDVQVHSTGAQSMKVSWKPPPDDVTNGIIKGYYIGYRISSTSEPYTFKQVEKSAEGQQQSTYITGLQPFTKYDIVVKAFNSAGAGPKSAKITGKTLETAPPTSPVVQIAGSTKSSIDIKWEKDPKDKSAITEYTLHYKTDDGNWQHERLSSDADKYTLKNLRCGTRYHLYMTASNSLGTGEPSEAVLARTKGAGTVSFFFLLTLCEVGVLNALGEQAVQFAGL